MGEKRESPVIVINKEGEHQISRPKVLNELVEMARDPERYPRRLDRIEAKMELTGMEVFTDDRPFRSESLRRTREKEGVLELDGYLQSVAALASVYQNEEMGTAANKMRETLVIIGQDEVDQAMKLMAERLSAEMAAGTTVMISGSGFRSERFFSLQLMHELHQAKIDRDKLKYSADDDEIGVETKKLLDAGRPVKIVKVDDFRLSGSQARGMVMSLGESLLKAGVPKEKISELVEMQLVAGFNQDGNIETEWGEVPVSLVYGVNRLRNSEGGFVGNGITGTHCSTDYGFDDEIAKMNQFLTETVHLNMVKPALACIKPPYDNVNNSGRFQNQELQEEFDYYQQKYGFKKD